MNKIKTFTALMISLIVIGLSGNSSHARINPPGPPAPAVNVVTDAGPSSTGGCVANDTDCLETFERRCRSTGDIAVFRSISNGGIGSSCTAAFSREIRDNPPSAAQNCQVGQNCYCSGSSGSGVFACMSRLIETCVGMGGRAVGIGIVPDVLRAENSVAIGACAAR